MSVREDAQFKTFSLILCLKELILSVDCKFEGRLFHISYFWPV